MRIVLHIGLHKTASTFLQWEVFSSFHKTPLCQDSCVLYNPKSLIKSLSEISYLDNIYKGKIPDKEKEKWFIPELCG